MTKERQPSLFITTGGKGKGKTFRTVKELRKYALNRPVLVFDTNREQDYADFRTVALSKVHLIKYKGLYKVIAKDNDGIVEQQEILYELLDGRFRHGLLVFDDFNKYVTGARNLKIISAITTNRHKGLDLIIQLQSVFAIDDKMWQNCGYIRMHHENGLIDSLKTRRKNAPFEILKIAQLIVNDEYKNNEYFSLYVNLDYLKLLNTSKKQFSKAAKSYLTLNSKELKNSGLTATKWINEKAKEYLQ